MPSSSRCGCRNHVRAIFAEGAFNAAFVPAYARIRGQAGAPTARLFADRVFTMLFAVEVVLLGVALLFTPAVISLLAIGTLPGHLKLVGLVLAFIAPATL